MSPWHMAILGGLLYGIPFGIWLLGGLQPAPDPLQLESAYRAFLCTQILALIVVCPALVHQPLSSMVGALILLQAVPWPLLVLVVLTGSVPLVHVLSTQGAIALAAVGFALIGRVGSLMADPWLRLSHVGLRGLALLGLIYATRVAFAGLGS